MKIPTPSFFKIRLVILAISFVVFCFVVGVVKDVFGQENECYVVKQSTTGNPKINRYGLEVTHSINLVDGSLELSKSTVPANDERYYSFQIDLFYYNHEGNWRDVGNGSGYHSSEYVCSIVNNVECIGPGENLPSEGCQSCDDEEQAAIAECGVDKWEWTNESTCEWECTCPPDYIRWQDECVYCPSGEFEVTSGNCINYCPHGTNEKVGEYIIYNGATCIVPPCGEGEYENAQGICKPNCPDNYKIDRNTGECELECGVGYEEIDGECSPSCPSGTVRSDDNPNVCVAPKETINPNPGKDVDPPSETPPDKEPEPDTPDNPNDPSDKKLGAIHDELQKLVEQGNERGDQLSESNDKLGWIGDNAKIIADNTAEIGEALNDLDEDIAAGVSNGVRDGLEDIGKSIEDLGDGLGDALQGIHDGLEGLEDNLEGIGDTLDEISEGTYTSPEEEEEYGIPEHDFNSRTEEFFSDMKTTGFFSFPDQLSSAMPSGGISTMEIDGGETFGSHTIDFNDMSSAINILKYVIQIFCMTIAIRIITLKR